MWTLKVVAFVLLFVAAFLEIQGDVWISKSLRPFDGRFVLGGLVLLCAYGLLVNTYNLLLGSETSAFNFSRLLGIYIACFAVMNLVLGLRRKPEEVTEYTIIGTLVVAMGGVIIQFGPEIVQFVRAICIRRS